MKECDYILVQNLYIEYVHKEKFSTKRIESNRTKSNQIELNTSSIFIYTISSILSRSTHTFDLITIDKRWNIDVLVILLLMIRLMIKLIKIRKKCRCQKRICSLITICEYTIYTFKRLMCNCILILNKYLLIRVYVLYVYIRKKIVNKCIVKNKRFYYKI